MAWTGTQIGTFSVALVLVSCTIDSLPTRAKHDGSPDLDGSADRPVGTDVQTAKSDVQTDSPTAYDVATGAGETTGYDGAGGYDATMGPDGPLADGGMVANDGPIGPGDALLGYDVATGMGGTFGRDGPADYGVDAAPREVSRGEPQIAVDVAEREAPRSPVDVPLTDATPGPVDRVPWVPIDAGIEDAGWAMVEASPPFFDLAPVVLLDVFAPIDVGTDGAVLVGLDTGVDLDAIHTGYPVTTIVTHPAGVSNDPTGDFTFNNTQYPVTYECRIDDGYWTTCDASYATPMLTDGWHTLWVRAAASAPDGGILVEEPPASFTWTIDTVPPDTVIAGHPPQLSNSSTANFTFISTESPVSYECKIDDGYWTTCGATWTTPSLSDGTHTVSVRARDAAGNVDDSPATYAWETLALELRRGLVAYYPLDDDTRDHSGSGADATNSGASPTTGKVGGAYWFDGSSTYLTATRTIQDDYTICAWIKTSSVGNGDAHYQTMPIYDSEVEFVIANDLGFGVNSQGMIAFGNGQAGMGDYTVTGATAVNVDRWTHVCGVRVKATGELSVYVDGIPDGAGNGSTASLSANPNARIGYGYDHDGQVRYWDGAIDEVAIWDRPLSTQEVLALYNTGSGLALGTRSGSHKIALGWGQACAVKDDGTLWCWGRNEWGQVGDGTTAEPKANPAQVASLSASVVEVATGQVVTCARKSDGTLWCWGWGCQGQLAQGTQPKQDSAVPLQTVLGSDVVQVALGDEHNCARNSDGTLWCWGRNDNGQLGIGSTIPTGNCLGASTPAQVAALGGDVVDVSAGGNHTCARKSDGTLWCWGENDHGELGDGTTNGETCPSGSSCRTSPVQVAALGANVVEVATGYNHTCARKSDGTLWCWGSNANGQLGDGTITGQSCAGGYPCKPSPVQVSALGTDVVEVAAGGSYYLQHLGHTCARRSDGTLWCWGSNVLGQLGDGTTGGQSCSGGYACSPSPTQVAALGSTVVKVTAGVLNTCARKNDGTLWCWGHNGYGQIGDGTSSGQSCYDGEPCKPSPTQTALSFP
jgi:alpha-tubulin suppressor-like RCC1 family protein